LLADAIEANAADPDFFLRKGIGWALRQHARLDPDWVRTFVATHDLSPLTRREALKHLWPAPPDPPAARPTRRRSPTALPGIGSPLRLAGRRAPPPLSGDTPGPDEGQHRLTGPGGLLSRAARPAGRGERARRSDAGLGDRAMLTPGLLGPRASAAAGAGEGRSEPNRSNGVRAVGCWVPDADVWAGRAVPAPGPLGLRA